MYNSTWAQRCRPHCCEAGFNCSGSVSAEKAKEIGMIYEVVEHENLMEKVQEFAQLLAKRPTKGFGLTKRALNLGLKNDLFTQLRVEKELQIEAANTYDNKEGIAAFLEKRKPEFKGK